MTAPETAIPTRFAYARGALAHTLDPSTWRRAFELRTADATVAPALRVGLATAVVLVAGGLLGYRELAGFAALGALASAFGRYEPYPRLAGTVALVGAALVVSVAIGGAVGVIGLPVWAVIAVLSMVAGVASAYMNAFRLVGPGPVIPVFAATGAAGYSTTMGDAVGVVSSVALGVFVGWLAAMVPGMILPLGPARLAAARALAIVGSLERVGAEGIPAAHAALSRARDVLAASGRARVQHGHGQDLADLLDAAAVAVDLWSADGNPTLIREIARHEIELRKIKRSSAFGNAIEVPSRQAERPVSQGILLRARDIAGSVALRHTAFRVAAASAAAGWIAAACGIAHPLWASLGAIAALQGLDYSHTVQRGIQRLLGNIGGAAIAAGLLASSLGFWPSVAAVVLLQFAAELMVFVNYGLTTLAVTPMALVMTGFTAPVSPETGISRIVDTFVGVVIGVVVAAVSVSRADRRHIVRITRCG